MPATSSAAPAKSMRAVVFPVRKAGMTNTSTARATRPTGRLT